MRYKKRHNVTSEPIPLAPNSCPNCLGVGWVESEIWSMTKLTKRITMKDRCQQCNGSGIIDTDGPQLAQ